MRRIRITLAVALAFIALSVMAGSTTNNTVYRSFGVDVTGTAAGFTIASKINNVVPVSNCSAWLFENDDDTETIWIAWAVMGSPGFPVAVADATDAVDVNGFAAYPQQRLKPGQTKRIDAFTNSYISVIATGDAHLHAEQTCGGK